MAAELTSQAALQGLTTPQLIEAWDRVGLSGKERNELVRALVGRAGAGDVDAWPSGPMAAREIAAGLYPDPTDPKFAARLFAKREFYDARAVAADAASGTVDPCTSAAATSVFELTPVQRIVSRYMSPRTPYMGLLLFHGVGVGKTCSAVTIAEQFLDSSPKSEVIVVLPQALKDNFRRTVFDADKMRWIPDADGVQTGQWTVAGCTGTSYLERLDLLNNPDERLVRYKIDESRRERYRIIGYQSFANWIERTLKESIPAGLTDPVVRRKKEDDILRRLFSDRLIIIDEAHNLRDTGVDEGGAGPKGDAEEEEVMPGESPMVGEAAENAGGKALNPFLKRIVLNAEGLRLVLMTATPMYNSAPEILLLLNYLIMNDTKRESSAFKMADYFMPDGSLTVDAKRRADMSRMVRRYVSYMRGENPFTFPLRLKPADAVVDAVAAWPRISASKKPVDFTAAEEEALRSMPFVFTEPVSGSPVAVALREATSRAQLPQEGDVKVRDAMLDARMQMANLTYPNAMFGPAGWDSFFQAETDNRFSHKLRVFRPRPESDLDGVFQGSGLQAHAPKIHRVVESVTKARGICFVYSRYIKSGALPLAVALERAGFQRRLADGRLAPVLSGVAPVAPVCAICGQNQATGDHSTHPFRPATYVLLTSEEDISPGFANLVQQAATWPDDPEWGPLGGNVKVVIGSQVASEGLDLKCIREMHVLDAWYHMNRIDQIVGRAIRYCSHTALRPVEKRIGVEPMTLNNCLIYLHAVRGAEEVDAEGRSLPAYESADMYAYRIAIGKALKVGEVQRLLKQHAWDCNLEIEAIIFAGLPTRDQQDAQGRDLDDYSVDDQDYTSYCDYQKCKYECAVVVPKTEEEGLQIDMSTYRYADSRRLLVDIHAEIRALFREKAVIPQQVIRGLFTARYLTDEIITEAIMEIINPRRFQLTGPDGRRGFLVAKAGYVVFQPAGVTDTEIPMTLRFAQGFQLQRRFMDPSLPVLAQDVDDRIAVEEEGGVVDEGGMLAADLAADVGDTEEKEAEVSVSNAAAAAVSSKKPVPAKKTGATQTDRIMGSWMEWLTYVQSKGEAPFPSHLHATLRIWTWILKRYAAIPDAAAVALRWWVDTVPTFAERRLLIEVALGSPEMGELYSALTPDLIMTKQINAYRIYNPITHQIEYFCRSTSAPPGTPYSLCDTNMAKIMDKAMGNTPVPINLSAIGPVMGFLTNKKTALVFKTLMLDPTKPKTPSTVGAECGNTSNLGEHQPRIRELQAAAASESDLGTLMLPDRDTDWQIPVTQEEKTALSKRQSTMTFIHIKDITHKSLCMYMEFLTRLLDGRRVGGRRWFLNAVAAYQSGLRGKK